MTFCTDPSSHKSQHRHSAHPAANTIDSRHSARFWHHWPLSPTGASVNPPGIRVKTRFQATGPCHVEFPTSRNHFERAHRQHEGPLDVTLRGRRSGMGPLWGQTNTPKWFRTSGIHDFPSHSQAIPTSRTGRLLRFDPCNRSLTAPSECVQRPIFGATLSRGSRNRNLWNHR